MTHLSLVSIRDSANDSASRRQAASAVGGRIERFLNGESDGGELLRSLYDHVLDEPVPARLMAVLGRAVAPAEG